MDIIIQLLAVVACFVCAGIIAKQFYSEDTTLHEKRIKVCVFMIFASGGFAFLFGLVLDMQAVAICAAIFFFVAVIRMAYLLYLEQMREEGDAEQEVIQKRIKQLEKELSALRAKVK